MMSASVVRNLELFVNLSDGKELGTLFKVLNQTQTRFGDRLLRKWMSLPLVDAAAIEARLDAVDEAMRDEGQFFASVKSALKGLMDLERGLATIFYKKCEFLAVKNVIVFNASIGSYLVFNSVTDVVKLAVVHLQMV